MTETLVVEDQILIGINLKQMIENCGYEVCGVATEIQGAWQSVEEDKPELIIMDIGLVEGKEGFDLAGEFKQKYDPTIVACTSYSDPETLGEIHSGPLDGYVLKPLDESHIEQLLGTVFTSEAPETPVQLERGELFDF